MALKCNWKVFMMVKMCFLCGVLLVKIGRVSLLAGGFTEENGDLEVKAAPQQRQDGRPPAISKYRLVYLMRFLALLQLFIYLFP